ncbi:MAG: hypothetical protein R3Y28_03100 [Candidatus Gastranaerophilales bacterium]
MNITHCNYQRPSFGKIRLDKGGEKVLSDIINNDSKRFNEIMEITKEQKNNTGADIHISEDEIFVTLQSNPNNKYIIRDEEDVQYKSLENHKRITINGLKKDTASYINALKINSAIGVAHDIHQKTMQSARQGDDKALKHIINSFG